MLVKVIGIRHVQGSYQGREFNNFIIYGSYPESHTHGLAVKDFKCSSAVMATLFTKYKVNDASSFVGKNIKVYFNQYGSLETFEIESN